MVKAALILISSLFLVQDGSDIYEVKYKYEKLLKRIDGVQTVTVGGVDGDLKFVIRVRDLATKAALLTITKRGLDGHAVQILVAGKKDVKRPTVSEKQPSKEIKHSDSTCKCPCHSNRHPGKTVAEPSRPQKPTDPYLECDWVRRRMRMKPLKGSPKKKCSERLVTTNDPKKIAYAQKQGFPMHQSAEMSGWTCYTYIRHRRDCPIGDYEGKVKNAADGLTNQGRRGK